MKSTEINHIVLKLDKMCRLRIPQKMRYDGFINDYYAYYADNNTIIFKHNGILKPKSEPRLQIPVHLVKAMDFKPFETVTLRILDNEEYSVTKGDVVNESEE